MKTRNNIVNDIESNESNESNENNNISKISASSIASETLIEKEREKNVDENIKIENAIKIKNIEEVRISIWLRDFLKKLFPKIKLKNKIINADNADLAKIDIWYGLHYIIPSDVSIASSIRESWVMQKWYEKNSRNFDVKVGGKNIVAGTDDKLAEWQSPYADYHFAKVNYNKRLETKNGLYFSVNSGVHGIIWKYQEERFNSGWYSIWVMPEFRFSNNLAYGIGVINKWKIYNSLETLGFESWWVFDTWFSWSIDLDIVLNNSSTDININAEAIKSNWKLSSQYWYVLQWDFRSILRNSEKRTKPFVKASVHYEKWTMNPISFVNWQLWVKFSDSGWYRTQVFVLYNNSVNSLGVNKKLTIWVDLTLWKERNIMLNVSAWKKINSLWIKSDRDLLDNFFVKAWVVFIIPKNKH